VSVITEGQGLNITVHSYLDRLDFGLVCCPELVPDVHAMLDAILAEIDTLAQLSGVTTGAPDTPAGRKPRRTAAANTRRVSRSAR
jgi:diacylglycerol O-acyltransferase / wax synthase